MNDRDTILILNEDTAILRLLDDYFQNFDFEILLVSDKESLMDIVACQNIAVVIIGIRADSSYDHDILIELSRYCPDAKIVLISGYPTVESVLGALRAGVYDVIIKPFRLGQLASTVKRAIAEPRYRQQVELLKSRIKILEEKYMPEGTSGESKHKCHV